MSNIAVTPLVGVWIEINVLNAQFSYVEVTPLVGVWIEMSLNKDMYKVLPSLPSWECGLK